MQKKILSLALGFAILCNSTISKSQTTLAPGDIAFTGYNGDVVDNFSFILLKNIASGTTINFTDNGWKTGACGTNGWATATTESEITWTAGSALNYGNQVVITGLTATNGTVTGTVFNLAAGGDQIFAYQGPRFGVFTMLAGIHMNKEIGLTDAAGWDNLADPLASQSNRPPCLVNGTHALFIEDALGDESDNARLKTSVMLTGDPNNDRALINNLANWDLDDSAPFALPPTLTSLPLHFSRVNAYVKNNGIQVEWNMDLQENVLSYIVEKSADGRTFTEVATIPASTSRSYSWVDLKPFNTDSYYRIKAVELSGTIKYTSIMSIRFSGLTTGMTIYPTIITSRQINLQMKNLPKGNYILHIYNSTGQLQLDKMLQHTGGTSTVTLPLPFAAGKGIYNVKLASKEEIFTGNFIVE